MVSPGLTTWVCGPVEAGLEDAVVRAAGFEAAEVAPADDVFRELPAELDVDAVELTDCLARAMAALASAARAAIESGSGLPISSVVPLVERGGVLVRAGGVVTEREVVVEACCLGVVLTGAEAVVEVVLATAGLEGVAVREEEAPDVDTSNGSFGRLEVWVAFSAMDEGPFPYQATSTTSPNTDNSNSALVPAVIFDVSVHQRELCIPLIYLSARLLPEDEKALGTRGSEGLSFESS